jgi:hypothetical protein
MQMAIRVMTCVKPGAAPRHPYPAPTRAIPPIPSHDSSWKTESSSWVTESAYKAPIPHNIGVGADAASTRQRRDSQSSLRRFRLPIADLYQKHKPAPTPVSWWTTGNSRRTSNFSARTSNETIVAPPTSAPQPKFRTTVIRYEGTDDLPILRRPAPVPYELRPSERAAEAKKHDMFRARVADILCVKLK